MPHLRRAIGRALSNLLLFLALLVGWFVLSLLYLLAGCASVPSRDPSPEHPQVACIARNLGDRINPRTGGRVLPEIVRLIGRTSPEDGERWMVVRGVYNRAACVSDINSAECGWLPFDRASIATGGICGRQADATREVDRFSASNP